MEFKEKFFDVALGIGHEIGLELRNGAIEGDPREPTYEMMALVPDPDNPGQFIPGEHRNYQINGCSSTTACNGIKDYN
jgi:hypothetical protein